MPWNDPRTWVDGETPTGAMFNAQIRDNLKFLKETPQIDGNMGVTGDVSATGDVIVGDEVTAPKATIVDLTVNGNANLGDAASDVLDIKATVVGAPLKTYTETRVAAVIAAGALALDCALGTYFKVALNSNCTVSISNAPLDTRALGISIIFTADGTVRAITWPSSVVWPSGVPPTMTGTNGKRDWITLVTEDGGVTWFGVIVGQNY